MDEEKYLELKMLALKERLTVKNLVSDLITDYVKKHGDGNPQFTMDQFEDPDFMACPAFYRSGRTWNHWLSKQTSEELLKFKTHLHLIDANMVQYL